MSFKGLVKRNNVFYFRTRIPQDLRPFFERVEVWKSLQTRCLKSAKARASKFLHETENTFLLMRCGMLSGSQISQVAVEYLENLREGSEHRHAQGYIPFVVRLGQHSLPEEPSVPAYTLSEIVEEHVKEALTARQWNVKSRAENEFTYRLLLDLLGRERLITKITHQNLLVLRDQLSRLPSNLNKKPEYRDKSIQEVLLMPVRGNISTTTLNKHLTRISSLFKWARKHGYIAVNYAEGLTLPKRQKAEHEREAYSDEDLQCIVDALPVGEKTPERFWIPLIGMYSGLRLNEICQLHVDDIREFDGIYCIDVNDKGDKMVKTKSSNRIVPVHPTLIDLGFVEHVRREEVKGNERVWGNLVKKRDGYAQDFGKYYQRFNRSKVTLNRKRVFHSFRHNVADRLKQIGVQETVISEVLGHSNDSITMGRYGKAYQPKVLLEALNRLQYSIDFEQLKQKRRYPS